MKKKTVITTEKHEVWVIREGIQEATQPIDISDAVDFCPVETPEETKAEGSERNQSDDPCVI